MQLSDVNTVGDVERFFADELKAIEIAQATAVKNLLGLAKVIEEKNLTAALDEESVEEYNTALVELKTYKRVIDQNDGRLPLDESDMADLGSAFGVFYIDTDETVD